MPTVRAGDLPYQPFNSEVPSPVVPSTYQSIRAGAADFGADVGVGLEKLGRSIGQAADVAAEGAIARQEFENKVKADDYTNKYQESVTKLLYGNPDDPTDTGFLGKRGEDAARAYPTVYKNIIDLRNQMRGQLANDKQRLLFDGETRRTQILTLSHMGGHYEREFKNYATTVNKATAENGMAQAATGLERGDQAAFEDGIGKRMKAELEQARLMGTANNPEVINKILGDAREDAVKMKFQKLAETNPYKAKQFLDANDDALKPGEAHALRQSIDAQWRKTQAQIDAGEMPAPEGWNEPPKRSSAVDTTGTGVGHVAPKTERLAYYRQKADELGLNYDAILATVSHEGLNRYVGDNGQSFGDFQLYTGGGMGNEAENAGINIRDPKTWKQQADFSLGQMVAHKGDAEWFNSQWHGPRDNAPWAAHQFGKPSTPRVAAEKAPTTTKIDYAFGDSNAQLATNHGVPGEKGTDVVVGDSPKASWERMQARGPEFFKGKTILLSPGSSNDPSQVEFIEKQAAFAQKAGVAGMVIPGVGPGIPGGSDKANELNAQLAGIAEKYGAKFVMPDNWQKDGYHIAQVPKFLEKANAALQVDRPTAVAKPIPQVTGRGKPAPGPSGGSTPEELDYLEGGGGGDAPDEITSVSPSIKGLKLAPIPPPESGISDAVVPGLSEKIADLAAQPWAKENPMRLREAIQAARAGATARWTEQQRMLKLNQEEINATSEAQKRKYLDRFSREVVPEAEILQDKALKPVDAENMVNFQRGLARGGDPDAATDRQNWAKLLTRVVAPYGNPEKITTIDPIVKAATDKQISRQSMHDLMGMLDKQKNEYGTTTKALKDKFIALFKPLVEGPPQMAATDPEHEARYANFVLAVDKMVTDNEKAGKDPTQLFTLTDPKDNFSSPIGKLAKEFAAPFRKNMMPPPEGAPKVFNTPEEVKAEVGKSLTYDQAVEILATKFGKAKSPRPPIAPMIPGAVPAGP